MTYNPFKPKVLRPAPMPSRSIEETMYRLYDDIAARHEREERERAARYAQDKGATIEETMANAYDRLHPEEAPRKPVRRAPSPPTFGWSDLAQAPRAPLQPAQTSPFGPPLRHNERRTGMWQVASITPNQLPYGQDHPRAMADTPNTWNPADWWRGPDHSPVGPAGLMLANHVPDEFDPMPESKVPKVGRDTLHGLESNPQRGRPDLGASYTSRLPDGSAWGRYHFTDWGFKTAKMMNPDGTWNFNNKYGVASKEDFLRNPRAQEEPSRTTWR